MQLAKMTFDGILHHTAGLYLFLCIKSTDRTRVWFIGVCTHHTRPDCTPDKLHRFVSAYDMLAASFPSLLDFFASKKCAACNSRACPAAGPAKERGRRNARWHGLDNGARIRFRHGFGCRPQVRSIVQEGGVRKGRFFLA